MRSSIEEDIDINGDKPYVRVSNQVIEQFSAELYKKAYERVVKETVDKRELQKSQRRSKNQRGALETPEQLLEHYVPSGIVTTASPVQEEVKAQDVVSTLENVPKGHRQ